jgi:hypothetical protein
MTVFEVSDSAGTGPWRKTPDARCLQLTAGLPESVGDSGKPGFLACSHDASMPR